MFRVTKLYEKFIKQKMDFQISRMTFAKKNFSLQQFHKFLRNFRLTETT